MFQELKYKFQRAFRGYDETIKWDFLGYFQQFIKPLKEFCEQELKDIHPDNKKMIEVFTETLKRIKDYEEADQEDFYKVDSKENLLWKYIGENLSYYWN